MESYMEMLANHAKHAAVAAAKLGTAEKNKGLCAVADELIMQQELILAENQKDLKAAEEKGVKQSLIMFKLLESTFYQAEISSTGISVAGVLDDSR